MLRVISNKLAVCGLCFLSFLAVGGDRCSGGLIIDHFDSGAQTLTTTTTGTFSPGAIVASTALGGYRTSKLVVSANPDGQLSQLQISTSSGGKAFFSNGPSVSAIATMLWDANGVGLGSLDLTQAGTSNAFRADVLFSDQNLGYKLTVKDGGSGVSTFTTNLGAILSSTIEISKFSSFIGTADFTDVESIEMELSGPLAQDATFHLLETGTTVPEPASLAIWSLIAMAVGGVQVLRRRKHSA